MNRHVLVTGGSGFVGGAVLKKLKEDGTSYSYTYSKSPVDGEEATGINVDLLRRETFQVHREKFENVTDLIHAAAFVPSKGSFISEEEDFNATVISALLMLKNILFHLPNIERVVLVSSCYVEVDDPKMGFYGIGKKFVEDALHQFARLKNINSVAVRFPQIYGPGETHGMYINKFAELSVLNQPIVLDKNALNEKDALFIEDAAQYIFNSLSEVGNVTISVSSPKSYSVKEIAEVFSDKYQTPIEIPELFDEPKTSLHFSSTYNVDEFQLQYNLEKGVSHTVEYYRKIQEKKDV